MASSDPVKIGSKIISQRVVSEISSEAVSEPEISPDKMNEQLPRPDEMTPLEGSTYKIRDPNSGHALYVTINNITLNPGTDHEQVRPFEIFINSKNMDHFQWVVALTRVMSAVFRKGGDVTFLVEELKVVFDPRGGYWKTGKYCPSLIADLGNVLENHFRRIGMMEPKEKAKVVAWDKTVEISDETVEQHKEVCSKCGEREVVIMDGCRTCLACGDSKCG